MTPKSKILYLSYDGLTDPLGRSQILPYLLGLSSEFDITVVSFEKPHLFETNSKTVNELVKNKINWVPQAYTKNPPVFSTFFDLLVLRRTSKKLVVGSTYKIVHCRSYIASLVGLWLKKKYGLKFIFDMRGFWVDERVEGGLWRLSNIVYYTIYKYFKRKEIQFLEKADYIITLTNKAKEIIAEMLESKPLEMPSIKVIPCCADTDSFNPDSIDERSKSQLQHQLKIKSDNFVLLYLGSIGTWYMLNEMLDFFKVLLKKNPKSVFLFVTGDSEQVIVKNATDKGIDANRIIVTKAPREDVPLYISLANFSIFFIKPTFSKQASSPTKLGETLALGVPSIANSGVGDIDGLFQQTRIGFLVDAFTNEHYQSTIDILSNSYSFKKEVIRNAALEYFSLKKGLQDYATIYKSLL